MPVVPNVSLPPSAKCAAAIIERRPDDVAYKLDMRLYPAAVLMEMLRTKAAQATDAEKKAGVIESLFGDSCEISPSMPEVFEGLRESDAVFLGILSEYVAAYEALSRSVREWYDGLQSSESPV